MSDSDSSLKSETRGAHAVAWLGDAKQAGLPAPILMVGLTAEEAAEHLRAWLAKRREQSARRRVTAEAQNTSSSASAG